MTRYCACEKCGACKRDGTAGLCELELERDDNAECSDCTNQTCNRAGMDRWVKKSLDEMRANTP